MKDAGREEAPFELVVDRDGREERVLARAVIDASGTWTKPNPLGAGGVPALASARAADRIVYGIPDVLGARPRPLRRQARPGGRQRPLGLQRAPRPGRAARRTRRTPRSSGRCAATAPGDKLRRRQRRPAARSAARSARPSAELRRATAPRAGHRVPHPRGRRARRPALVISDGGARARRRRDRRDHRLPPRPLAAGASCGSTSTPRSRRRRALAPLIDPNVHSCGTVPPHGVDELAHPEPASTSSA